MLAYSGRGRFAIEPIDLNRLVRDMTRLLELSIPKTTVVRYEFGEPLPGIEGDAAQIRQVLVNLMTNAAEAIGERGGVISLRTGAAECGPEDLHDTGADAVLCPGIYVYLEVTDTGTGMDEETRQKIFDPFFSTKFVGRGLGLPAAIGIARGHKGGIRVWSEPGKGSTFRVLFPAREEGAADSAGPDAGPARWRGSGTVLLVDDDETVRTVAKAMLRRMGFDVLTAGTGREALDVFGRCRDATVCVVLDLTMPQMDGEATFRELRRMKPDVPVVLSSGHDETDVLNRFAGLNLSGFIQKPYTSALLEEKLRGALGQPASGTALQTRKPDPRAGASDGPCGSC
jgi:CheY-like chemotaxis protein